MPHAFVAFPSAPVHLRESIERGLASANAENGTMHFHAWPENDIAGRPLTGPILSGIEEAEYVVADVTFLNFNVTYEIGFSIGAKKRVYLIRNNTFHGDTHDISKVGIFDTLGYAEYDNSIALTELLNANIDATPLQTNYALDDKAPVYLLETPHRGEAMSHIISRIKKTRLQYRSFSPSEEIRIAAIEAIKHVSSSHGVVVPLLSPGMRDAAIHNMRAAFVAGLAHGMEKPRLILQGEGGLVPLDVRDFAKSYQRVEDINDHIHNFALDVVQSMQASEPMDSHQVSVLASMSIGDPMAENEFQTLERYYLRRDEYGRTIRRRGKPCRWTEGRGEDSAVLSGEKCPTARSSHYRC